MRRIPILFLFALGACSQAFDFRSEDRPVYERSVNVEQLAEMSADGVTILDIRLLEDFNDDPVLIPDAMYRDPDDIAQWAVQMSPTDEPVVVYCVRGKWVSQKAANYLSDQGHDVYVLDGGIEAWKADGRDTSTP